MFLRLILWILSWITLALLLIFLNSLSYNLNHLEQKYLAR
jgi:hypothetical protein